MADKEYITKLALQKELDKSEAFLEMLISFLKSTVSVRLLQWLIKQSDLRTQF